MYYLMSQRSWGIAACAPAAFLFATSIAVTFTACSDDLMADNSQPVTNPESDETLFEAYGLTSFFGSVYSECTHEMVVSVVPMPCVSVRDA